LEIHALHSKAFDFCFPTALANKFALDGKQKSPSAS
jgi:hypothetical protein